MLITLMLIVIYLALDLANAHCIPSSSQSNEEENYISHFMPYRTGTYVEIGALDGHQFSNTRVLSKCYNWTGLLVEGNLHNYVNLVTKLDRNNVEVVHSAVCEPPQRWTTFTVAGGAVATDTTRVSESFQRQWSKSNHPENILQVPCAPMSELLLPKYAVIDFFSLDVEGAEWTVVNTIDFSRVSIDTFCIELDNHDIKKNVRITNHLAKLGYKKCKVPADTRNGWFRRKC